jgi:hypothetical protein
MSADFEKRLTDGFSDLSRSFETVFAAYSTLLNRAMVQQAIGGGDDATGSHIAMPAGGAVALPEHERRPQAKAEAEIDHEELRRRLYAAALSRQSGAA